MGYIYRYDNQLVRRRGFPRQLTLPPMSFAHGITRTTRGPVARTSYWMQVCGGDQH